MGRVKTKAEKRRKALEKEQSKNSAEAEKSRLEGEIKDGLKQSIMKTYLQDYLDIGEGTSKLSLEDQEMVIGIVESQILNHVSLEDHIAMIEEDDDLTREQKDEAIAGLKEEGECVSDYKYDKSIMEKSHVVDSLMPGVDASK